MMGAVIWMIFVLQALAGAPGVIALLSALLVAGVGAWVWGRWGAISRSGGARVAAACVALVLALGGPAAASVFMRSSAPSRAAVEAATPSSDPRAGDPWQAWSPERVAQLRQQGVPVFVDFTARWCITCQVNERVALDNPAVRDRFRSLGVTTLRADWTDRNDLIARTLADQGRAGVPLYLLYVPGAAEPVILPEVLTPAIVLAALDPAR
jgi:thiol:disulfide interchange protein